MFYVCSGEKRREMLRKAYRLGYESGREDAAAERVAGAVDRPANGIDFEPFLAGRLGRTEIQSDA
jgi:hypothetical protein